MKTDEELEELLTQLKEICFNLGWLLSFDEESDSIRGMIIGTDEFIAKVLEHAEDFDGYETFQLYNNKKELH